ncbi:hypothetical protein D3C81_1008810 [compost metagenome]
MRAEVEGEAPDIHLANALAIVALILNLDVPGRAALRPVKLEQFDFTLGQVDLNLHLCRGFNAVRGQAAAGTDGLLHVGTFWSQAANQLGLRAAVK